MPVAWVVSTRDVADDDAWDHEQSHLVLDEAIPTEALTGIESFSHLEIIAVAHQVADAATHSWRGLAPLLARDFFVIAPDLPGHGFTDPLPDADLSLPGMAEESFVRAVQRWDNRRFLNPGALAREVPEVWRKGEPTRNGFIGFMRAVSAVSERMTGAMLDHYERKWELLLRGFSKE